MRAITRRLLRLENQTFPPEDVEGQRLIAEIRERRRRRLEASGLPFEERPQEPLVFVHGRHPTISEILWNGLERRGFRKSQR